MRLIKYLPFIAILILIGCRVSPKSSPNSTDKKLDSSYSSLDRRLDSIDADQNENNEDFEQMPSESLSTHSWAIDDTLLTIRGKDILDTIKHYKNELAKTDKATKPDKFLFLLGKIRRAIEYSVDSAYAGLHEDEYNYNEIGGSYLYTGLHFYKLIDNYPQSEYADDAAYEITNLSLGGECEGYISCYIERNYAQIKPFLEDYPKSPLAVNAIKRINYVFDINLKYISNLDTTFEYYDPKEIKSFLEDYSNLLEELPSKLRIEGYILTADLWSRFSNYVMAKSQYEYIVKNAIDDSLKKKYQIVIDEFPTTDFKLDQVAVIGYYKTCLTWKKPNVKKIIRYEVFRKTTNGNYELLTTVYATTCTYYDSLVSPNTEYKYKIRCVSESKSNYSNESICITDRSNPIINDIIFSDPDKCLYIFSHLSNGLNDFYGLNSGTPEILKISSNLQNVTRIKATFWGLENNATEEHDKDKYFNQIWIVDKTKQIYRAYNKSNFINVLPSKVIGDADWFRNIPDNGLRIAIGPDSIWLEPASTKNYSTYWNGHSKIFWWTFEDKIYIGNNPTTASSTIDIKKEHGIYATTIFPSIDSSCAWFYLPQYKKIIKINSAGKSLVSFPLTSYYIFSLSVNEQNNCVWSIEIEREQEHGRAKLIKRNLSGEITKIIPMSLVFEGKDHYRELLTTSNSTGSAYIVAYGNNSILAAKIDTSGNIITNVLTQ